MPANRPRHPNARLVKPAEVVLLPVQARKQGGHCVLIWLAFHSSTGVGLSSVEGLYGRVLYRAVRHHTVQLRTVNCYFLPAHCTVLNHTVRYCAEPYRAQYIRTIPFIPWRAVSYVLYRT